MKYNELNVDIWDTIIAYLNLKSIYNLELADNFFREIMQRTKIWQRKIKNEFPDYDFEHIQTNEEIQYKAAKNLYWSLYILGHECNFCKLCFIDDACRNIPDCTTCNWLEYLDW